MRRTTHSTLSTKRVIEPGASLSLEARDIRAEARVLEHGVRARLDEREQLGHLVGNR